MPKKINTKAVKLHIKKGDNVKVLAGNHKNKTGRVITVFPQKYRAIVEGMHIAVKHIKPSTKNPKGRIEKKEASMHMSNLMLIDPASGKATRIGRKRDENNKLCRYAKKTGEIIKNA